jgi:hypothetical protein
VENECGQVSGVTTRLSIDGTNASHTFTFDIADSKANGRVNWRGLLPPRHGVVPSRFVSGPLAYQESSKPGVCNGRVRFIALIT